MKVYGIGHKKNIPCGMGDSFETKVLHMKCWGGYPPLFTTKETCLDALEDKEFRDKYDLFGKDYGIIEFDLLDYWRI